MDARAGKWLIAASLCIGSLVPARALACWPLARDIPYDDKRPLITLHGSITDRRERQFSTKALNDVLATLLVSDRNGRPYPFVLYVHGRGNEPSKSFSNTACGFVRGHVLEKIEKDDVRVLGINWDSKARTDCERPIDRAEAAAPLLEEVVRRLLQHRRENPKLWSGRPATLLVHSMGSFVLRKAMENEGDRKNVLEMFDVRVLTGSDAPVANHVQWVPAGSSGQTVVVTNSHDGVLDESLDCDDENHVARQPRLGMLSSKEKGAERASGILYLEAEVGDSHRTFTRGGANQNEAFCGAMASLLRGKLPSFDSAMHVDHQANLLLMRRSNHVARCTAGEPEDRDDD